MSVQNGMAKRLMQPEFIPLPPPTLSLKNWAVLQRFMV